MADEKTEAELAEQNAAAEAEAAANATAEAAASDTANDVTNSTDDTGKVDVEKLTGQVSELQSKYDTLSQNSSKDKQLLEEITPYVDFEAMKRASGGDEVDEFSSEGEDSYLTQAQAKALEKRVEQKIATADFVRDFRSTYPDVADGGALEEWVRFYFEKTPSTKTHAERTELAVKMTRDHIKAIEDKALSKANTKEEKAAAEAKAKAEAAAKASGLSSTGITPPKTEPDKTEETASDYIASRKARLEALKSTQT